MIVTFANAMSTHLLCEEYGRAKQKGATPREPRQKQHGSYGVRTVYSERSRCLSVATIFEFAGRLLLIFEGDTSLYMYVD